MKKTQPVSIIIKSLESILVISYILFEELIWNNFAQPVYQYFKKLAILNTLEQLFLPMNRYLVLFVFIMILLVAEVMGLLSGLLVINGYIIIAILVYLIKIPIAALTFWLFQLCKDKLMSFHWLNVSYQFIMKLIEKFVSTSIYISIKENVRKIRIEFKIRLKKYFGSTGLIARMKKNYWVFRNQFSRPS